LIVLVSVLVSCQSFKLEQFNLVFHSIGYFKPLELSKYVCDISSLCPCYSAGDQGLNTLQYLNIVNRYYETMITFRRLNMNVAEIDDINRTLESLSSASANDDSLRLVSIQRRAVQCEPNSCTMRSGAS